MAQAPQLVGSYIGRSRIREGMESLLAPVERKRITKCDEAIPLDLNVDGTFTHKRTTRGRYQISGDRIVCTPEEFNGSSLRSMKQAAEQAGRAFGLSWLFDPFELQVEGLTLVSGKPKDLIYVEYLRNPN